MDRKQRMDHDIDRLNLSGEGGNRGADFVRALYRDRYALDAQRFARLGKGHRLRFSLRIVLDREDRQALQIGQKFGQDFEPLRGQPRSDLRHARDCPAGMRERLDVFLGGSIAHSQHRHHVGRIWSHALHAFERIINGRNDDGGLQTGEFFPKRGVKVRVASRVAYVERDGLAVDPAEFRQMLDKSGDPLAVGLRRAGHDEADERELAGRLGQCWHRIHDKRWG
jgi:hypothetical protein